MIMFLALLVTMVTVTAASEDLELLRQTADDIKNLSQASRQMLQVVPHVNHLVQEYECAREADSCKDRQANTMLMKLEFGSVNCDSEDIILEVRW